MERTNTAFKDPVKVTCYYKTKTWERQEALEFFLQGAWECDGAESERYFNIYYQLINGATEAYDDLW